MAWDTVFQVGGMLHDTLLQAPFRLAANQTGVFVLDHYSRRLIRFDKQGDVVWSWGGRGAGPDELAGPRDLHVDSEGRAWVLDPENARLVIVGANGKVDTRAPLDGIGLPIDVFVPMGGGEAMLVVSDRDRPLVRLSAAGEVLERRPFPWQGFRRLDPLAAQLVTATDPSSSRWAAAFAVGDGFFAFDGERWLGYRGWYTEPVAFPDVRVRRRRTGVGRTEQTTWLERTQFAAGSIALEGRHLQVLFRGRTPDANRLVDIYHLENGRYLESLLLPVPATALAYADSVYYLLAENPYPELLALMPR